MQPANKLLYFLPGFMGSALTVNNQAVWLDMAALMWGDFSRLSADATNVSASLSAVIRQFSHVLHRTAVCLRLALILSREWQAISASLNPTIRRG